MKKRFKFKIRLKTDYLKDENVIYLQSNLQELLKTLFSKKIYKKTYLLFTIDFEYGLRFMYELRPCGTHEPEFALRVEDKLVEGFVGEVAIIRLVLYVVQ